MNTGKLISVLLAVVLLLTLTACSGDSFIGTWETELDISLLGVCAAEAATSTMTVTVDFAEDSTGTWSTAQGGHPAPPRPFTYTAEGDTLTLTFTDGTEEYTYSLDGDVLTLISPRITLNLTRS